MYKEQFHITRSFQMKIRQPLDKDIEESISAWGRELYHMNFKISSKSETQWSSIQFSIY